MSSTRMSCGRVRRLLWPDAGPQAVSPAVIAAQEHLLHCESCQRFVRSMRELGDVVRTSAVREPAPAELRRRLFTAVARVRAGVQPSTAGLVPLSWLVAAVTLLVALGGTLAVDHVLRHRSIDPVAALAEDHARALGDAQILSGDPSTVSRWLAAQVHFAMLVPTLPDARLLGARLRVIDGRRGAAVRYEANGVALTYFVVPDGRDGDSAPMRAGAGSFEQLTRAGYHVVAWREPGLLHAMVGGLSTSQLTTFAEACIKQARGTVVSQSEPRTFPQET